MAKINFPGGENFNIDNELVKNIKYVELSKTNKITNSIFSYLEFISNSKIIPDLPSNINIQYINENKFNIFIGNFFNIEKYKYPKDYTYPASMVPGTSTIYISTDFNKASSKISKKIKGVETNDIVLFRGYFNQDNQKSL